ncbi:MAG: AAA family ATPase [Planctomycetaceae bacterium]
MLISFSVANFRSFGDEVTLNLVASNKLSDHSNHRVAIGDTGRFVLRTAVIYGANAAGKSNLVRAMQFAQRMIEEPRRRALRVERFRLGEQFAGHPSTFEFRFLLGERVFCYGFDLNGTRIEGEWLTVLKGDDDQVVYERDAQGTAQIGKAVRLFPQDKGLEELLKSLSAVTVREDQLFLTRISEVPEIAQGPTLASVVKWLTQSLVVLPADYRAPDLLERLQTDPAFMDFSATFLRQVGTGIDALEIEESEREAPTLSPGLDRIPRVFQRSDDTDIRLKPDDPSRMLVRQLRARHDAAGESYPLPFSQESDGTRQLLHLMPVLATPAGATSVYVIDELDRSLHPLICQEFIRLFSETCPNERRQLIVTTHDAHLLDQELLRRDEYWFVEKDAKHQSQLTSLADFSIRNDLQIQKGYLQGRFGAIPIIGSMEPLRRLLQCGTPQESADAPQETPARP